MTNVNKFRSSRLAVLVALVVTGAVIGIGSTLIAQADDPQQATLASLATASGALGGPVPQIRDLPPGLKLRAVGVDSATTATRSVHLSYGNDARNLVLLTISAANIKPLEADEHLAFDANDVAVTSRDLFDGTRDVGYAWNAGPYGLVLHVNLSAGLNRELADRMAKSVR